jgi:hypothetical protein
MSENNNEQMDLGSGTASNNNLTDTNVSTTSPISEVSTTENTTSKLKLTIKTPKDKKDISIDGSSTVKQVKFRFHFFSSEK